MNKMKKILVCVALLVLVVICLTGCKKDPKYTANSGFFYSADKGHSYGDGTKEYVIGETVYMKVKYIVASDQDDISQVKAILTVPKVQNVDAKYMDGQVITPNYDAVNNVTTYEFTANASKTATESECVIQFVPNAAGTITMTLVFDDKVDSSYDRQSTLVFVEPKETTQPEE